VRQLAAAFAPSPVQITPSGVPTHCHSDLSAGSCRLEAEESWSDANTIQLIATADNSHRWLLRYSANSVTSG